MLDTLSKRYSVELDDDVGIENAMEQEELDAEIVNEQAEEENSPLELASDVLAMPQQSVDVDMRKNDDDVNAELDIETCNRTAAALKKYYSFINKNAKKSQVFQVDEHELAPLSLVKDYKDEEEVNGG